MQAGPPRPLIGADELASLLADEACTVLDVRYQLGGPSGPGEYAAGHIPGAAYVDLDSALAGTPGSGVATRCPRSPCSRRRCGGRRERRPPRGRVRRLGRSGRRPLLVAAALGGPRGRPRARRRLVGVAGRGTCRRRRTRCCRPWATSPRARAACGPWRPTRSSSSRGSTCSSTRAPPSGSGARPSRWTRSPATFPGAVNVPTGANLAEDGRFRTAERARRGLRRGEGPAGCGVLRLGRDRPPTTCSPWPWPGSRLRCTPDRGASGWPIPSGRWRPAGESRLGADVGSSGSTRVTASGDSAP